MKNKKYLETVRITGSRSAIIYPKRTVFD